MRSYYLAFLLSLLGLPFGLEGFGFIIGPNWPPSNLPVQFTSRVYRVSIVPAPTGPITLTPSGPGLTFTPSSLNFDPNTLQQDFTFSSNSLQFATISWIATAPYTRSQDLVFIVPRTLQIEPLTTSFPVNKNVSLADISIKEPATGGLILTASVSSGTTPWTLTPTTFDFSTGNRFTLFGLSTITGPVQVSFQMSGSDAVLYELNVLTLSFTVNFRTVTVPTSVNLLIGQVTEVTVTLDEPPPTSITVTGYADGVSFNPPTITITNSETSGTFFLSTNVGGIDNVIFWSVGGVDGGLYALSSPTSSLTSQLGTITVSVPGTMDVDANQTMAILLSVRVPPGSSLTVTPNAANIVFNPPSVTFNGFCTQAEIVALPTAIGTTNVFYVVSGPAASLYLPPASTSITVNSRLLTISTLPALIVGVPSPLITVTLQTSRGEVRGVPDPLTITPCVNPPSLLTFTPSSFTITPPAVYANFTITPNQVQSPLASLPTISFDLSGAEANWFTVPILRIPQIQKASFIIPSYVNSYFFPPVSFFPIGVVSGTFSISVVGLQNSVTLTPVCDLVTFNPPQLVFQASGNPTLSFTITGQTVGTCAISYVVTGPDANFFIVPQPSGPIRVINNFILPTLPSLPVGVLSPPLHFGVANIPSKPVWVTLSAPGVVFIPSTFILSSNITDVTFQMLVTDSANVQAANPDIPGWPYLSNLLFEAAASSTPIIYTAQEMGESASYFIPSTIPQTFSVLPGYFNVSIPELRLGVTSQMTVTVHPPPRTNVILTIFGNNLVFVPPSVTFLPEIVTVRIDVTPIIQSNTQWNIPFKVNYLLSGANAGDYLTPPESLVSVQRPSVAPVVDVSFLFFILVIFATIV
jgi:hypothetical protein